VSVKCHCPACLPSPPALPDPNRVSPALPPLSTLHPSPARPLTITCTLSALPSTPASHQHPPQHSRRTLHSTLDLTALPTILVSTLASCAVPSKPALNPKTLVHLPPFILLPTPGAFWTVELMHSPLSLLYRPTWPIDTCMGRGERPNMCTPLPLPLLSSRLFQVFPAQSARGALRDAVPRSVLTQLSYRLHVAASSRKHSRLCHINLLRTAAAALNVASEAVRCSAAQHGLLYRSTCVAVLLIWHV